MGGITESIFGGAGGEGVSGTADVGHDYGALWSTYSRWVSEEKEWRTGELERVKSSMAAGGQRSGTEGWESGIRSVESAYEKRMADLENTETARILRENWRESGGGGDNMLSWYEEQFGKSQVAKSGEGDSTGKARPQTRPIIPRGQQDEEYWLSTRGYG